MNLNDKISNPSNTTHKEQKFLDGTTAKDEQQNKVTMNEDQSKHSITFTGSDETKHEREDEVDIADMLGLPKQKRGKNKKKGRASLKDSEASVPNSTGKTKVPAIPDFSTKPNRDKWKKATPKTCANPSPAIESESTTEWSKLSGSVTPERQMIEQDLEQAQAEQLRLLQEQDLAQEREDPFDRKAEYTYEELLARVTSLVHANNPDLIHKRRLVLKPPQVLSIGRKKTVWVNFQETCTMLERPPQHVFAYFTTELGTEANLDGQHRLVIRGRYLPNHIESLLKKYAMAYVTCHQCKSANTDMIKDKKDFICHCRECKSERILDPIRSGYHATNRDDRRAARENQK